jgi:uncharacterized protein YbjT (DUF2867 family)
MGRFSPLTPILLSRGHRVRAATRDPNSAQALQLRRSGAEVVRVDLDDPRSIERAAHDVDAVFTAGTAHAYGPTGDRRHGRAIVDAAAAAEVGHLVLISVAGADHPTKVPLFESKRQVEQHLRTQSLPHTIIAPVYLMENLWNPWNTPVLAAGQFPSPLPAERKLQQIALADVVELAADVLERPSQIRDERIEIASDELNALEGAHTVAKLIGRPLEVEVNAHTGPTPLYAWLDRVGYKVNLPDLRQRFPAVHWHSYQDWAKTQDWSQLHG